MVIASSAVLTLTESRISVSVAVFAAAPSFFVAATEIFCRSAATALKAVTRFCRSLWYLAGGLSWDRRAACCLARTASAEISVASWASVLVWAVVISFWRSRPSLRNWTRSVVNPLLKVLALGALLLVLVLALELAAALLVLLLLLLLLLPQPAKARAASAAVYVIQRIFTASLASRSFETAREALYRLSLRMPVRLAGVTRTNVPGMTDDEPTVEELKQRQLAQEVAERDALNHADTDADADKHQRRADKARYLREKLQEREQADRDADPDKHS